MEAETIATLYFQHLKLEHENWEEFGVPKLSVIVPVYNGEAYLTRCVESILGQTFTDLELILVDDGSPDRCGAMIDEFAQKDDRVIPVHQENRGPGGARNAGLRVARGEYVNFVDQDDYVDSSMYEKMLATAETTNSDMTVCSFYEIGLQGEIKTVRANFEDCNNTVDVKNKLLYMYYIEPSSGLAICFNKILRKKLIDDNALAFNEKVWRAEDWWFIFDYLKCTSSVVFMPESLYYKCDNSQSVTHTINLRQYDYWVLELNYLLKENESLGFDIDYNRFYCDFLIMMALYCRDLAGLGEVDLLKRILSDEFYQKVAKSYSNTKRLILIPVMLVHKMAAFHLTGLAVLVYRLWSLADKAVKKLR